MLGQHSVCSTKGRPVPFSNSNLRILNQIDEIYVDNPDYGYRMIHQQLLEDGYNIGNNRVLKYMGVLEIQALYPHKKKITSIKNSEHPIYPYLLKPYWYKTGQKTKAVKVDTPNKVWSGDITYIRMNGGFMYLAAVIDWNTRAILGLFKNLCQLGKITNTQRSQYTNLHEW